MGKITKQQVPVLVARLVEFQEKFDCLSSEDGQYIIQNTAEAIRLFTDAIASRNKGLQKTETKSSILRLISGGEKIMIEVSDGKAYISDAKKTFKSGIDGDFENWGLNQSGPATAETLLDVNEMVGDGNFVQIFTGITSDLDKLVMTQAQIIRFCEKHPTWLRQDGYATFFLIKVDGEYFVVRVLVIGDGLYVSVRRLENGGVWSGGYRHRVVSPQLIPLAV